MKKSLIRVKRTTMAGSNIKKKKKKKNLSSKKMIIPQLKALKKSTLAS